MNTLPLSRLMGFALAALIILGTTISVSAQVTFYTDRATYQANAAGAMIFEDYEDSNVGPGEGLTCVSPADNSGDGGVCFDAGDIEVGIEASEYPFRSHPDFGLVNLGADLFSPGLPPSSVVCANFLSDGHALRLTNGSDNAFGAQVAALKGPSEATFRVFNAADVEIGSMALGPITGNFSFFAGVISASEPIAYVVIDTFSSTACFDDVEIYDDISPTAIETAADLPQDYLLSAPYPNPFNPQSQFTLAVAQQQYVTAELFNTLGQRVAVLFEGTVGANQGQQITIDGAGLASGMYVVRVNGERFSDALSVTLLR